MGASRARLSAGGVDEIARYIEKTAATIGWDNIRREVQYRINLAAATWRVAKLNEILPTVQEEYEAALLEGTIMELEPQYVSWMDELLKVDV